MKLSSAHLEWNGDKPAAKHSPQVRKCFYQSPKKFTQKSTFCYKTFLKECLSENVEYFFTTNPIFLQKFSFFQCFWKAVIKWCLSKIHFSIQKVFLDTHVAHLTKKSAQYLEIFLPRSEKMHKHRKILKWKSRQNYLWTRGKLSLQTYWKISVNSRKFSRSKPKKNFEKKIFIEQDVFPKKLLSTVRINPIVCSKIQFFRIHFENSYEKVSLWKEIFPVTKIFGTHRLPIWRKQSAQALQFFLPRSEYIEGLRKISKQKFWLRNFFWKEECNFDNPGKTNLTKVWKFGLIVHDTSEAKYKLGKK